MIKHLSKCADLMTILTFPLGSITHLQRDQRLAIWTFILRGGLQLTTLWHRSCSHISALNPISSYWFKLMYMNYEFCLIVLYKCKHGRMYLLSFTLCHMIAVWRKTHCTFEKVCYTLRFFLPQFWTYFYIYNRTNICQNVNKKRDIRLCSGKFHHSNTHVWTKHYNRIYLTFLPCHCLHHLQIKYLWQTMGIQRFPIRCSLLI